MGEHLHVYFDSDEKVYTVRHRRGVSFPKEFIDSIGRQMILDTSYIYGREKRKKIDGVRVYLPPNPNVIKCDNFTRLDMYVITGEKKERHKTMVMGWAWKQDLYNGE